jgi:hypothetical protein
MNPFFDSTDVADNGPELRKRMERDGYLFIRGLMPADKLESLRLQLLEIARRAGWVKKDAPLDQAIADLNGFCIEPEAKYSEVYLQMYKLQEFQAIYHHPELIALFERLLGDTVLLHPSVIGRTIFPQRDAFTTPAHQDFIPIQGSPDTYTAWIPLSDVPEELGGLQIATGSHRQGVYEHRPSLGAGGMEVIDPLEGTWVGNPFKQSDLLIFHSLAVHKGLPNRSNQLRLSLDGRYQKVSEPISEKTLVPHGGIAEWEDIYANWPTKDFQYYWKKWDLNLREYDYSYHQKRDEMAFEMAENGDSQAVSTLQRIIARDNDPAKRKKAEALLKKLEAIADVS